VTAPPFKDSELLCDADAALIVDMDGTLLRNDYFKDTLRRLLLARPWTLLRAASLDWVRFKERVLGFVDFDAVHVRKMANEHVLSFVERCGSAFETVELVSGSPQFFVERVGGVFACFDACVGSAGGVNLVGLRKLEYIRGRHGRFCYIGDSAADEVIFRAAEKYVKV